MIKKINKLFRVVLILFAVYYLIKFVILKDLIKILTSVCVPILVILSKYLKDKVNDKLVFIYYFYIFILLVLGGLANFYELFKYYDVFAHFMSGFASCICALYILKCFKIQNKSIILNIIMIIITNLAIASFWEILEYIASFIVKSDPQDVLESGVKDTMEDIIASLIASILFIFVYVFKKDKLDKIIK